MREMGSLFRKKDLSDKKRFRKLPFDIEREVEPTSEKELGEAVAAIEKDKSYVKRISVDLLKDEFNTIRNWIKNNPPADLEQDKKDQLDILEKAASDAFSNIRPTKFKRGDVAGAELAFRTATYTYLESIGNHSDKIKNLLDAELDWKEKLYNAIKIIGKDETYIIGKRINTHVLKYKFDEIKSYVGNNLPNDEEQKKQISEFEKNALNAFNDIKFEKFKIDNAAKAEQKFRNIAHNYVKYVINIINALDDLFMENMLKECKKRGEKSDEMVLEKSKKRMERMSKELIQQSLEKFYEFLPPKEIQNSGDKKCVQNLIDRGWVVGKVDDYLLFEVKIKTPDNNNLAFSKEPVYKSIINVKDGNVIYTSIYRNKDQKWRNENFPPNFQKIWNLETFPEEFGQALHSSDLRAFLYQKAVENYLSSDGALGAIGQQPKCNISNFPLRVVVESTITESMTLKMFSEYGQPDGTTDCPPLSDGFFTTLASPFGDAIAFMLHDYPEIAGAGKIKDSQIYKEGGELYDIKISIKHETPQNELVEIS